MTNTRFETTLRELDAATGIADEAQRQNADARLARILATPVPAGTTRRPRAPRFRRLAAMSAVTAIAVTVGLLVLRGSGGTDVAYASWTAVPTPVAGAELDAVLGACREQLGDGTIPVELAERRGDYVAVLFFEEDPETSMSCIATNRPGSTEVDQVITGAAGSSGPAWTPPAGQITEGASTQYGGDHPASLTEGAVGRGVVGVTIHAGTRTIVATVEGGRYAAWWPGAAFKDEPVKPSGQGGPELALTYDVHLAGGSVERDVKPTPPS